MARVPYSAMTLPTGVAVGLALDAAIGDPHRGHPVAAFGIAAAALERRMWRDDRLAGAAFTCVAVGGPLLAAGSALLWGRSFLPRVALTAAATWAVVGGTTLGREARGIGSALVAGDVEEARVRLPALVGRDPASLSPGEIARAVVESVAENTSDAVVAPLVWGALAGVPGMVAYRAINTLDAMVGYRSERYEQFGWAAARLDDAANWLPARITGWLVVGLAPYVGGGVEETAGVLRRDGGAHPSPNSGRCEAAFAGALEVTLGGRNVYAGRVEERPLMGSGRPVVVEDVERAVRLSTLVSRTAGALAVAVMVARAVRCRA